MITGKNPVSDLRCDRPSAYWSGKSDFYLLRNGWYKGRLGYEGASQCYGTRFAAIVELHIWYEDGSETVVAQMRLGHTGAAILK